MREYVVCLNKDVDYDTFWNEMETITNGLLHIPDRAVEIVNNRDGSLRSCHYSLTDEEATLLQNDSRVYCVEIPPDQRTDIKIGTFARVTGNYSKPLPEANGSGSYQNWGLRRVNSLDNSYGTDYAAPDNNYNYILDGRGVDVVIQDSGLEISHPEFAGRVQQIDWYTASGLAGTQSANHYRDYDGHGTHVAGITAGKTFGWARGANVYSLKVSGLEGAGDSGTGISISDCFDVIKLWHRNKPVDATTGYKRPTVVNASWGYTTSFARTSINSITWRGNTYSGVDIDTYIKKGNYGLAPIGTVVAGPDIGTYLTSIRINSVDVDVEELIDEGVIFIAAAGNHYTKIERPGGEDYDNYVTVGGLPKYQHRGSSPSSNLCIKVGCLDSSSYSSALDQKATFSCCGDGVDVYAPGSNIISCTSTIQVKGSNVEYYADSNFGQLMLGGTSQASPQVSGLVALYLQTNPSLKQVQVKQWLSNIASSSGVIYNTGLTNDYMNYRSISGVRDKILYNPFAIAQDQRLSGGLTLTNLTIT